MSTRTPAAPKRTVAAPKRLFPGQQDVDTSKAQYEANKATVAALIEGPPQALQEMVGAYVTNPRDHAAMRAEVRAALLKVSFEMEYSGPTLLSDLGARYAYGLKRAWDSPLKRKVSGQTKRGGKSRQARKLQRLLLFVVHYLLRNMPGGLDGARTSLSVQTAQAARRWRRIRAGCTPGRCAESCR